MKTLDMKHPLTAKDLNENLYKNFNVKINFDKYTREQLENYRNLLRTKVNQSESQANFNELLANEDYQKDKFVLTVLNTRIKEMLGEAKNKCCCETKGKEKCPVHKKPVKEELVSEKAVSRAQQKFMGMVHATQKGKKAPSPAVAKAAKGMSKKAAKDYASTKHKGLPGHVGEGFTNDEYAAAMADFEKKGGEIRKLPPGRVRKSAKPGGTKHIGGRGETARGDAAKIGRSANRGTSEGFSTKRSKGMKKPVKKGSKPDFLDLDKDGNKKEPMKQAAKQAKFKKVKEAAKPDYLDLDRDGNKKEPMKKAAKDAKMKNKRKVKESSELIHKAYQRFIAEGIANYIAEDEEGKAKAITAAADIVNDFTSWMQRVGNYQTKSMIELADNIRANFGMQEAETFKQSVGQALEGALSALTAAREEINNAVAVLAGEAPSSETMGPSPEMGEPDLATDLEPGKSSQMNVGSDEFAASDAAAGGPETTGRMKRESIERGNRLMRILGA